jgi:hypothetical protein
MIEFLIIFGLIFGVPYGLALIFEYMSEARKARGEK